ncbi:hypothetical protein Pint_09698 [Pistacia integerrima]|uniref:Uncharacterized protein n=1 Tax=Pistacia integerrima TaxID=434235 RepID=A0ACC0XJ53_9ROSI|nr:hypothetical protein Pint_09698 [Pistacia integerrima]
MEAMALLRWKESLPNQTSLVSWNFLQQRWKHRTHKTGKCNYRRDNNLMQGELDQHLFSNWTRLEYLELHKNDFTGLQYFTAAVNSFTGPIKSRATPSPFSNNKDLCGAIKVMSPALACQSDRGECKDCVVDQMKYGCPKCVPLIHCMARCLWGGSSRAKCVNKCDCNGAKPRLSDCKECMSRCKCSCVA